MAYENIKKTKTKAKREKPLQVIVNYVRGCRVDLRNGKGNYTVRFTNSLNNKLLFSTEVKGENGYGHCHYEYFIPWKVDVLKDGKLVQTVVQNLKGMRVYISLDTKSLGDTLAWFPYAEEFRKKHECKVICSTFKNFLFEKTYPEIDFVEPGEEVKNIKAQYSIGWYYNQDNTINRYMNPSDPRPHPMQKTACDILGLKFEEVKPLLALPKVKKENTVSLAIHSTSQAKYWNNPTGWQDVVDTIVKKKYEPVLLSQEGQEMMGNEVPDDVMYLEDYSMENTIEELCKSKLFVGVSTGLTWLAWACNVPVILISGFSEDYTEFSDCYRVSASSGCKGCFNKYRLNAADWKWCPALKGTAREFECSKSISSKPITELINQLI